MDIFFNFYIIFFVNYILYLTHMLDFISLIKCNYQIEFVAYFCWLKFIISSCCTFLKEVSIFYNDAIDCRSRCQQFSIPQLSSGGNFEFARTFNISSFADILETMRSEVLFKISELDIAWRVQLYFPNVLCL